jgi:hypothetical protein
MKRLLKWTGITIVGILVLIIALAILVPTDEYVCTSHYSMCRTMTDELLACLVIS